MASLPWRRKWRKVGQSRDGGDGIVWRPHLREDLVKPLEGAIEVDLDPARGGGHVLPVVLGAPPFHEAHPDGAHLGELVDHLEAVVDVLGEEGGELLVVEDLEGAARRDLADGGRVEAVPVVAVAALHEDAAVAEALGVDLTTHVVQVDA